jgi:hypothetical protein
VNAVAGRAAVPDRARRPVWWGVLAALACWALLAFPAVWVGLMTMFAFSGCFIECSQPDPVLGALGVLLLAVFVVVPILLGIAVVRSSKPLLIAGAAVVAAVVVFVGYGVAAGAF